MCAGVEPSSGAGATTLVTLDGSSTVFPISEAVAEEFQRATPGTRVTVGISGTGGGFQKFCRAETDISDASRPISASEIAACQAAGVEYVELPVAYDGIAIVVNPKAAWIADITVAELKTLWAPEAQGKVMRWNQVRASWPDREIHLVESDRRKAAFLIEAAGTLGLRQVKVHAARIESATLPPLAAITARALAPLDALLVHAARFLAPGGLALFPKGRTAEQELTKAATGWHFAVERFQSRTEPESTILRLSEIRRAGD